MKDKSRLILTIFSNNNFRHVYRKKGKIKKRFFLHPQILYHEIFHFANIRIDSIFLLPLQIYFFLFISNINVTEVAKGSGTYNAKLWGWLECVGKKGVGWWRQRPASPGSTIAPMGSAGLIATFSLSFYLSLSHFLSHSFRQRCRPRSRAG